MSISLKRGLADTQTIAMLKFVIMVAMENRQPPVTILSVKPVKIRDGWVGWMTPTISLHSDDLQNSIERKRGRGRGRELSPIAVTLNEDRAGFHPPSLSRRK